MIPRIIHQSWKTLQVPERWKAFQESWREHHRHYEYIYWTDEDNRALIARHFPEFLPVYDGYDLPIKRADLARYLVICRHGGIYADMDFEALRPLDGLLAGNQLLFGLEPDSHAQKPSVVRRGLSRVVCNALFASVPRHPFWEHFLPMLAAAASQPNVLDATGPYVLTRACNSYVPQKDIALAAASLLYPVDNYGDRVVGDVPPYAVHHWHGTWWREAVLLNAWGRIKAQRDSLA